MLIKYTIFCGICQEGWKVVTGQNLILYGKLIFDDIEGDEKVRRYLKQLRDEKGLTQQEVAAKMGIGQSYYSDIELAVKQTDMSLSIVQKLSEVLGVPIATIIEEEKKLRG